MSFCIRSASQRVGAHGSGLSSKDVAVRPLANPAPSNSRIAVVARAAAEETSDAVSRRNFMMGAAGVVALNGVSVFPAQAEELVQFYGAANPPATPSKLGGVPKGSARYGFKVPESWKEQAINKVEKGTNGTDARFQGPARKKEQLFVLTLLNYGGTSGFTMDQPPVNLLKSLTGSLPDFQDALDAGELTARSITKNGAKYFDYKLDGPDSYLCQVTVSDGRVFGMFIGASAKGFASDEALLQSMIDSFEVFPNA